MGQSNTERIQHNITFLPSTFRDTRLEQIIDDLCEEDTGKGYTEITYSGVFVTAITTWTSAAKTLKRTDISFTRTGAFVTGIVKTIYDQDTGLAPVSTITASINYDAQHKVTNATVITARV